MKNLIACVLSLGVLAGCTGFAPLQPSTAGQETDAPSHFLAKGRFSFSGETTQNGQFHWLQENNNFDLRLFGVFGLGSTRIQSDGISATLTTGGESYQSEDARQLLWQNTGLDLPLNDLPLWLLGGSVENNEWQTEQGNFIEQQGYQLPQRINLTSDTSSIEIAISEWQLSIDD